MSKAVATNNSVDLVSAIYSGEAGAETEFVRRYQRGLRLLLVKRVADQDAIQDLMQEIFTAAIIAIRSGKLREPGSLNSFIRQVAINQTKTHYRKTSRMHTNQDESLHNASGSTTCSSISQIQQAQVRKILQNAIQQLGTERDRQLLLRYYIYEEDKQDLCKDLSLSPEHFDRVLYRARQRMKQLLKDTPHIKDLLLPEE